MKLGRIHPVTLAETMQALEALGDEKVRRFNAKHGAGDNQFGCKLGDVRVLAKKIKTNPELAKQLWQTGNLDARFLATLLMKPKELSTEEVDTLVRDVNFAWLADWLMSNVLKQHPDKEELRQKWIEDKDVAAARAGWSLTAARVAKDPEGLDLGALLDRIEREMKDAPAMSQWTMNMCLAEIGINHPEHRAKALAIGEKLGVLRDYPVSKGCTSPFAPIWINEMVKRQG
jgi:3-methyladenine DNA glycosylase AlkD